MQRRRFQEKLLRKNQRKCYQALCLPPESLFEEHDSSPTDSPLLKIFFNIKKCIFRKQKVEQAKKTFEERPCFYFNSAVAVAMLKRRWRTVANTATQACWGRRAAAAEDKSRPALLLDRVLNPKRGIWNEAYTTCKPPSFHGSSLSDKCLHTGLDIESLGSTINKFSDQKLVGLPEKELKNNIGGLPEEELKFKRFLEIPAIFEDMWTLGEASKPFILARECYKPILESIMVHCEAGLKQSMVVMGSPGIGKPGFLFYCLWHLLSKEKRDSWGLVILKFHGSHDFYIFSQSGEKLEVHTTMSARNVSLQVKETTQPVWYLADWKIDVGHHALRCRRVLFCSPDEQNYRQFAKSGNVDIRYVPVWSLEELLVLNCMAFGLEPSTVEERYEKYGGIPRFVLQKRQRKVDADVEAGIRIARQELLATRSLAIPSLELVCKNHCCHRVYMWNVEPNFEDAFVSFASNYIAERVSEFVDPLVLHSIFSRLPDVGASGMQGQLFDANFQQYWCCNNGRFDYRRMELCTETLEWVNLKEGTMDKKFDLKELPMLTSTSVAYPLSVGCNDMEKTIYKAQSKDQDGWDALVGRQIIQATVSNKRGLELRDSFKAAKTFLEKVFGVPQSREDWFELVYLVPHYQFEIFDVSLVGAQHAKKGRPTDDLRRERLKAFSDAKIKVVKMSFKQCDENYPRTSAVVSWLLQKLNIKP